MPARVHRRNGGTSRGSGDRRPDRGTPCGSGHSVGVSRATEPMNRPRGVPSAPSRASQAERLGSRPRARVGFIGHGLASVARSPEPHEPAFPMTTRAGAVSRVVSPSTHVSALGRCGLLALQAGAIIAACPLHWGPRRVAQSTPACSLATPGQTPYHDHDPRSRTRGTPPVLCRLAPESVALSGCARTGTSREQRAGEHTQSQPSAAPSRVPAAAAQPPGRAR